MYLSVTILKDAFERDSNTFDLFGIMPQVKRTAVNSPLPFHSSLKSITRY